MHENAVAFDSSSECQHLPDNVCSALCRCLDRIEDLLTARIGYFGSQDLDRHHDRRKDIVEIMGDTPGERTNTLHALSPQKLCRKSLFLGHITGDYDDLRNHSFCIPDHASLRLNVPCRTIFAHEPIFESLSNAGPHGFLKNLFYPLLVFRMNLPKSICLLQRLRVPQNIIVRGAVIDPPAVQVQHCDHVSDILRDQAKLLFTLFELCLRVFAFRNVPRDADHRHGSPCVISHN